MQNFENRNIHPEFDALVEEWLGFHVYVLCDGGRRPFYVGKGGGQSGKGNARLLDHFAEARKISPLDPKRSAKIARIHEVWQTGDVQWFILRRHLPDAAAAFEIECSAIDLLKESGIALVNDQGGHRSSALGLVARPADLFAQAAKPFDCGLPAELLDRPIFLFNIGKAVASNDAQFEAATREAWKVSPKFLDLCSDLPAARKPVALGLVGGISRAAIVVDEWECTDHNLAPKDRRWRIVSRQQLAADGQSSLLNRNFKQVLESARGFWGRGGWIAFRISSQTGQVEYLRGVAKGG